MSKTGSVAPKERINIKYTPATEGQTDCCRSRILRNVTAKCGKFKILQVSHL